MAKAKVGQAAPEKKSLSVRKLAKEKLKRSTDPEKKNQNRIEAKVDERRTQCQRSDC